MNLSLKNFCLNLLLIIVFTFCLNACRGINLPVIEANQDSNAKETQLGESKYYIMLPNDFIISEARGKEGQLGYNIMPKDKSSNIFGFIEIKHGKPIEGSKILPKILLSSFAKSRFLNKEVIWSIQEFETGYSEAFTTENGDLNASASSKDKEEIKKMISIIITLKEK